MSSQNRQDLAAAARLPSISSMFLHRHVTSLTRALERRQGISPGVPLHGNMGKPDHICCTLRQCKLVKPWSFFENDLS